MTEHLALLALGGVLGFLGGLFGIGGGIIVIPLLVLAFGMEQAVAQGTALVMMVPNLLMAWWRYSQRQPVPLTLALQIGAMACVTTWAVAHVATQLAPDVMQTVFSVFLLVVAVRMAMPLAAGAQGRTVPVRAPLPARWMPWVGVLGGSCMGLLGVGGGLVATPVFVSGFGQRQTVAQSLSLALVAPSSMIALLTYSNAQRVNWSLGWPLALGGLLTVSTGVTLALRLPERRMRQAFAAMVFCTALWLLVRRWVLS